MCQIAIGLAIFGVYLGVAHGLAVSRSAADARGADLLAVERWLHIAATEPLNNALRGHTALEILAAWEYATTYIITTFGLLGVLWARADPTYRWARDSLAVTTLLGVACFALWPTAPPRLLPGERFVDIVAIHHPPLSWGGGPVSAGANQFAAMPSLHVAWAVWMVVASMRARRVGPAGRAFGAAHLGVTMLVVLATANHYVLDLVAGGAAVAVAAPVASGMGRWATASGTRRVAAADELFLHVQTATNPQYVGGVAMLDTSLGPAPTLDALRRHLAARLSAMSRLTRRVVPAGRLRHHRWASDGDIDLSWHVRETHLPAPGGQVALDGLVARLSVTPLDPDRPPWRIWLVRGLGAHRVAVVVIVHHAVADGLGVVALLRHLLDLPSPPDPHCPADLRTPTDLHPSPDLHPSADSVTTSPDGPAPGPERARRLARAARTPVTRPATVVSGLVSLARDGAAPPMTLSGPLGRSRAYLTTAWSLPAVRSCAHRLEVTVTDLLLAAVGSAATAAVAAAGEEPSGQVLRAAVPVTMRMPGSDQHGVPRGPGNLTAALRLDVPLGPMPPDRRAEQITRRARDRRASGRLPASAAALRLMGALPAPLHRAAARSVYRARFFTAIVSNMRGAPRPLELLGCPLRDVFPIVPLAAQVPLSVGALGWNDRYCVAATVDPARLDPVLFGTALRAALAELTSPELTGRARTSPPPGRPLARSA
ncbi:bifunctional phosphatase PAP2/O-acyltransferase family protein [Parafrankia irregularis]|uniref:bifunctional phosphatase PAP2/O-acyltransferase family protein n=1 Tax=Parafrankia irregularis TaxID=795642 RepID=UPI0013F4D9CD|nr:phosphatase PAP2 family protein [Parafrankia irregularis]